MSASPSQIADNIRVIQSKIERAAAGCNRDPSEIMLIAASKGASPEQINAAIHAGVTNIGENRVQELLSKYPYIIGATWHFIGRLQTNKVKYIIDKVDLIHSVCSTKLAEEINKQAGKIKKIQKILIQINFFEEKSKNGILADDFYAFAENLSKMPNIKVCGIMLMAPRHVVTKLLQKCNNFVIDIRAKKWFNISMGVISFGMSGDFEQAIGYGSTAVRIGNDIFNTN
ncbi:MAG: YggS family pyridoxal phosphate-dependent enzyme [Clostridiales bacterium]|jgi:pyridoxal phosphate enzyme (YggS family)|nr:YggS family pyridoxal phosphate-dependent enzyme [Clostridiales bacterium]